MAHVKDENLPEVVPDSSPQAFSQAEYFKLKGLDGGDGKYPYGPGWDGEKYIPDPPPLSPASGHEDRMPVGLSEDHSRRLCRLGKRVFRVVTAIALAIIIAVSVGVGVGISQNSGGSSEADALDQEGAATLTKTPNPERTVEATNTPSAPASSPVASPSPSPTITFLNNQTESESQFAFQAYSHHNYGGQASHIFVTEGFIDLPFAATSYVWIRNETNCCLTFCQGSTEDVGYWCHSRRQPEASSNFDRIYVWCGKDPEKEKIRCVEGG